LQQNFFYCFQATVCPKFKDVYAYLTLYLLFGFNLTRNDFLNGFLNIRQLFFDQDGQLLFIFNCCRSFLVLFRLNVLSSLVVTLRVWFFHFLNL
jgi:hypothetical protein